jgi:hypothetical protein
MCFWNWPSNIERKGILRLIKTNYWGKHLDMRELKLFRTETNNLMWDIIKYLPKNIYIKNCCQKYSMVENL